MCEVIHAGRDGSRLAQILPRLEVEIAAVEFDELQRGGFRPSFRIVNLSPRATTSSSSGIDSPNVVMEEAVTRVDADEIDDANDDLHDEDLKRGHFRKMSSRVSGR